MVTNAILGLRILPRWIIILIDALIIVFSITLAYLLRFNFELTRFDTQNLILASATYLAAFLVATLVTKSYSGIVRYTGVHDGKRLLSMLLIMTAVVLIFNSLYFYVNDYNFIPLSIVAIAFLSSFLLLFQYRLLIKNVFSYYRSSQSGRRAVGIYGAGELGIVTQSVLLASNDMNYKIVCFFEDDMRKVGKVINGTPIVKADHILNRPQTLKINELIIATDKLDLQRTNEVVDACLNSNINVRSVPTIDKWVQGDLSIKQIKNVRIEDLLGRESIRLDNDQVENQILDRRVCVTGAAGSIGSELVRQVLRLNPAKIILIDQGESPLYELERELDENCPTEIYVADIRDRERVDKIFLKEKPEVVFHAAAYKHVPLMENNGIEAIKTNVFGTKNLTDLAVEHHVERFVMVSTDKAVNPTSIMGCTKRIAEIYVQSLNNEVSKRNHSTTFVTTRFGNVLGSNGSVIPFFKKQISEGGPVTVTHPEITRYFMTITEACSLVLEAGAIGKGGEIFIFDMGNSIKIVDLAQKMILLSGLELGKDIEIVYTGLRKGEKLYEELLADKENTLPTHHKKIMIAKVSQYSFEDINQQLKHLGVIIKSGASRKELITQLKWIVPEFINSDHSNKEDKLAS